MATSQPMEWSPPLPMEGALPPDLEGTLFRVGPGGAGAGLEAGALHAMELRDGRAVSYVSRASSADEGVFWHAGSVLALAETGLPLRYDRFLEPEELGGELRVPIASHVRRVAADGCRILFSVDDGRGTGEPGDDGTAPPAATAATPPTARPSCASASGTRRATCAPQWPSGSSGRHGNTTSGSRSGTWSSSSRPPEGCPRRATARARATPTARIHGPLRCRSAGCRAPRAGSASWREVATDPTCSGSVSPPAW